MKLAVTDDFRRSMHWLHTGFGIVLGGLLFAIFWMGTLSVFDADIDRWMKPELRLAFTHERISIDEPLARVRADLPANAIVNISPPTSRRPTIEVGFPGADGKYQRIMIDPSTGERIEATDTLGASGFFFPFHFRLHISWMGLGYWIVGIATMAMLALLVSGIFIHRKIIQDFFTFRPTKSLRRSTLDLHNLTALVALPFHFFLPLTGLIIFFAIYLPWGVGVPFDGDRQAFVEEVFGLPAMAPAGESMRSLASIDAMVTVAEATWSERSGSTETADLIRIFNLGDANASVLVRQVFPSRSVALNKNSMVFDGATGDVISDHKAAPVLVAHGWLAGLHFVRFDHIPLRWLYFAAGLAGCVMIATGNLFWIRARTRKDHEPLKVRTVKSLTVGSTTGIVLASIAFLVVNRLLPMEAGLLGVDRSELEVLAFWLAWVTSYVHAAARGGNAWADQAVAIGLFSAAAVVLNWFSTGDHLIASIAEGLWAVAGTDLALIAGSGLGIWSALKLQRAQKAMPRTGAIESGSTGCVATESAE